MVHWTGFAAVAVSLTVLVLGLARLSRLAVDDRDRSLESLSGGAGLAAVGIGHGLLAAVLAAAVVVADVPLAALGIEVGADHVREGLVLGVALGGALYVLNETGVVLARRAGFAHHERLRAALAPDDPVGWLVLLGGVLPLIVGFEELLFRASLIGGLSTGLGLSPWLLAVGLSLAFALGHGIQGPVGVAITGLLGLAIAAAFVLTWNLLLVAVAHYVVNALEFGLHEGYGLDWERGGWGG